MLDRPAPAFPSTVYRREIDGLRAVAVVSLVLGHSDVPGFSGGFLGIDILLVVAGFLIGDLLWRGYSADRRFSLRGFVIRRVLRAFPTFVLVAAVTTAVAWFVLLPAEFSAHGKALVASVLWVSNILFYLGANGSGATGEATPLAHTWVLAVAAQFVLFLVLAIWLLGRWRRVLVVSLIVATLASFTASAFLIQAHPDAVHYLLPFRLWEPLAGTLLAIWGHASRRAWIGYGALSVLGIALIAWSVLTITPEQDFTGLVTLVPVIGTLLLIANGGNASAVNIVLRAPVPVFIGPISYAMYLWHWPVLVLSQYLRGPSTGGAETLGWLGLTVALAILTHLLVERPARRAGKAGTLLLTGGAMTLTSVLLVAGSAVVLNHGMPDRFGPEVQPHIKASADFGLDQSRCSTPTRGPLMGIETCVIGPDGPPQLLVWGDDHVLPLHAGLDLAAQEAGKPGLILWRAGCPPLFDIRKTESRATMEEDLACGQANLQIEQAVRSLTSVRDVLLVGRWTYYATGHGIGRDAGDTILITPSDARSLTDAAQSDIFARAVGETVAQLGARFDRVAVLRQPPEIAGYDSRVAARDFAHRGLPFVTAPRSEGSISYEALRLRAGLGDAPFRALSDVGRILWLDTWPAMCSGGTCRALVDGTGYYYDNNRLTNSAGVHLRSLFWPLLPPDARLKIPLREAAASRRD